MDSAEQEALVAKLKAKYAPAVATKDLDAAAAASQAATDAQTLQDARFVEDAAEQRVRQFSANTDVKSCGACQGLGEITYEYNHRIMKKPCEQCKGEGCFIYVDGELRSLPREDESISESNGEPARDHEAAHNPTAAQRERIRELQTRIQQIGSKISSYSNERTRMLTTLHDASDENERSLISDVVARLDEQLDKLHRALVRQKDRLGFYDHLDKPHAAAGDFAKEP